MYLPLAIVTLVAAVFVAIFLEYVIPASTRRRVDWVLIGGNELEYFGYLGGDTRDELLKIAGDHALAWSRRNDAASLLDQEHREHVASEVVWRPVTCPVIHAHDVDTCGANPDGTILITRNLTDTEADELRAKLRSQYGKD